MYIYTRQFLMSQQWQGLLWFAGVSCTECFSPRSVLKSVLMTNPINRARSCPKTHHHWQFNRHWETSSWSAFILAQLHIPLIQWNPIMFALIARHNVRDWTFHSKPRVPGQHPWPSNPLPAEVKERYLRQESSLLSWNSCNLCNYSRYQKFDFSRIYMAEQLQQKQQLCLHPPSSKTTASLLKEQPLAACSAAPP